MIFFPFFYGTRMYGKVDKTPSGAHIATNFFHMQFIPLIPQESMLVLRKHRKGVEGLRVPLNIKSVLVTYARVFGVIGLIHAVIVTIIAACSYVSALPYTLIDLTFFGLLIAATYFARGIGVATASRARSIDEQIAGAIQAAAEAEVVRKAKKARKAEQARQAGPAGTPAAPDSSALPSPSSAALPATSDSFLIECPSCRKQLRAKRSLIGKTTKCPACRNLMEVGEPTAEGRPPAAGVRF